jgi:hypothetical protein
VKINAALSGWTRTNNVITQRYVERDVDVHRRRISRPDIGFAPDDEDKEAPAGDYVEIRYLVAETGMTSSLLLPWADFRRLSGLLTDKDGK